MCSVCLETFSLANYWCLGWTVEPEHSVRTISCQCFDNIFWGKKSSNFQVFRWYLDDIFCDSDLAKIRQCIFYRVCWHGLDAQECTQTSYSSSCCTCVWLKLSRPETSRFQLWPAKLGKNPIPGFPRCFVNLPHCSEAELSKVSGQLAQPIAVRFTSVPPEGEPLVGCTLRSFLATSVTSVWNIWSIQTTLSECWLVPLDFPAQKQCFRFFQSCLSKCSQDHCFNLAWVSDALDLCPNNSNSNFHRVACSLCRLNSLALVQRRNS